MTAAPGPQQPDEVRPRISVDLYATLRAAASDLGLVHGRSDLGRELRTLIDWHGARQPAAPSAQPDDCECPHIEHDPISGPCRTPGCMCVITVTPAQRVRDTEEGRR